MNDEARRAIRMIEDEAALADTHDIGKEGASRLRAATLILRGLLWGCLIGLAACSPPTKTTEPVTAIPNVSAAVLMAAPAPVAAEPMTAGLLPSGRARAGMAAPVVPEPFKCQAYAHSLLPWKGDPKDPIYTAASDATLPDAPEFLERRSHACAVLGMYKNSGR